MKETNEHFSVAIAKQVELDYLLYLPEPQSDPPPLLVFLHGAGERGVDLSRLKCYGPTKQIAEGAELPFIVLAPQCPADRWWEADALTALLDHVIERHEVDQSRIYLTGLSMGGHGTWILADACPGRFAAIAPICGPFAYVGPANFSNTPVWCFHGALDDVVSVDDSLRMCRRLRNDGVDVRLTIYPDAGHNAWTPAYAPETGLYDWLLSHSANSAPCPDSRSL